jgi:hypothetical protein
MMIEPNKPFMLSVLNKPIEFHNAECHYAEGCGVHPYLSNNKNFLDLTLNN